MIPQALRGNCGGPESMGTESQQCKGYDLPLGPYRKNLQGNRREVTTVEIRRAIQTLPPSKAPGPDGFTGRVYKRLLNLVLRLARMISPIYRTGSAPKTPRRIYLVPIPKLGRDPHLLSARRPMSPRSTAAKLTGAILYHRMAPIVDPKLAPQQYAYRRS